MRFAPMPLQNQVRVLQQHLRHKQQQHEQQQQQLQQQHLVATATSSGKGTSNSSRCRINCARPKYRQHIICVSISCGLEKLEKQQGAGQKGKAAHSQRAKQQQLNRPNTNAKHTDTSQHTTHTLPYTQTLCIAAIK